MAWWQKSAKGVKGAKSNKGAKAGSVVEEGCKICGECDHWKVNCPWQNVVCKHCAGEHLNRLCGWKAKAKGEGKGNGKDNEGKGKGAKAVQDKKGAQKAGKAENQNKGGKGPQLMVMCSNTFCGELNLPNTKYCQ